MLHLFRVCLCVLALTSLTSVDSLSVRLTRRSAQEVEKAFAAVGDRLQFQCEYQSRLDMNGEHALGFDVRECSSEMPYEYQSPEEFSLPVGVLGEMAERKTFWNSWVPKINATSCPFLYKNSDHDRIKNGDIRVLPDSDVNLIKVEVKVSQNDSGKCLVCGQSQESIDQLSVAKQKKILIIGPPTAEFVIDGTEEEDGKRVFKSDSSTQLSIHCVASGNVEGLTAELKKKNQPEILSSNKSVTSQSVTASLRIASVSSGDAGSYECVARTEHEAWKRKKMDRTVTDAEIYVEFAPEIQMNEVDKIYVKSGDSKRVQLKAKAYPQPKLTCLTQNDNLNVQESYDDKKFFAEFTFTLINLRNIHNETNVTCTVTNKVGSHQVNIRLTAEAPKPEIVSPETQNLDDNYRLKWQHHKDGNVDFYNIVMVINGTNRQEIRFHPNNSSLNPQHVKDPQVTVNGMQRMHSVKLKNVEPSTQYRIRVQACNQHGCSNYSNMVRLTSEREKIITSPASHFEYLVPILVFALIFATISIAMLSITLCSYLLGSSADSESRIPIDNNQSTPFQTLGIMKDAFSAE